MIRPHVRASLVVAPLVFGAGCAAAKPPPVHVASPSAAPPPADVPLPDTPAGKTMADWLRTLNGGSVDELRRFYETRYAPALNPPGAVEHRVQFVLGLRAEEGNRHVRGITRSTPTEIEVVLQMETTGTWWKQIMKVDERAPHLVLDSRGEPTLRPDALCEGGALDDAALRARLDAYVDGLAKRGKFSGAIAVARGDRVVYERAEGVASIAWNAPMRVDTKMNLGSMNKMFTSVAIAQLVAQGKMAYSDTLAKLVPDYPNPEVAKKITVHQLLTHTSGLGDYFNDDYERLAKDKLRKVRDYFPLFVDKPLLFEPGARFSYSNAGFMVLGAVVESVSGQDYFDYVRDHVYKPVGMLDTDAFEMDHDTPNLAIGYTHAEGDPLGAWTNNLYLHVVKGGPAGGGFSTVRDLTRFASALMHGTILDREHVAIVTTRKVEEGPGDGYGYGFGVQTVRGHATYGHNGGFAGINGHLTVIPDMGVSVAVLTNRDPPSADRVALMAIDYLTQK
jgi:CubicO group peptidase (beta-lactamase class C family)